MLQRVSKYDNFTFTGYEMFQSAEGWIAMIPISKHG